MPNIIKLPKKPNYARLAEQITAPDTYLKFGDLYISIIDRSNNNRTITKYILTEFDKDFNKLTEKIFNDLSLLTKRLESILSNSSTKTDDAAQININPLGKE